MYSNRKPSPGCRLEKGIFTQEEFLEMVRVVDQEMRGSK
jgi:hypothetical protein